MKRLVNITLLIPLLMVTAWVTASAGEVAYDNFKIDGVKVGMPFDEGVLIIKAAGYKPQGRNTKTFTKTEDNGASTTITLHPIHRDKGFEKYKLIWNIEKYQNIPKSVNFDPKAEAQKIKGSYGEPDNYGEDIRKQSAKISLIYHKDKSETKSTSAAYRFDLDKGYRRQIYSIAMTDPNMRDKLTLEYQAAKRGSGAAGGAKDPFSKFDVLKK